MKLKIFKFLLGCYMYLGMLTIFVLSITNFMLNKLLEIKMYVLELGLLTLAYFIIGGFLGITLDQYEKHLFHKYCKSKKIEPTLGNWNDWKSDYIL